jgi:hypothetical protein
LVSDYTHNLLGQTPSEKGQWDRIKFTFDPIDECDFLIIINRSLTSFRIKVPSENIWAIIQEPPTEVFKNLHYGPSEAKKVFTTDTTLRGNRYLHSQPAIPWLIEYNYDTLVKMDVPTKTRSISCITSNKSFLKGHQSRLSFLNSIRDQISFDLYGYGFKEIKNKSEGLINYKYSIAIENYRNSNYWSEKISDCFLSFTMPVYYGCNTITNFFPPESIIQIDIGNPTESIETIQESIFNKKWDKYIDAIVYAREKILQNYQFFPLMASYINKEPFHCLKKDVMIKPNTYSSPRVKITRFINTIRKRLL